VGKVAAFLAWIMVSTAVDVLVQNGFGLRLTFVVGWLSHALYQHLDKKPAA
jgi:hypothetical protein